MSVKNKRRALIIFAKEPRKGRVKTRLQKDLPAAVVLAFYKAFVRDVLEVGRLTDCHARYLYYGGQSGRVPFLKSVQKDYCLKRQLGVDLGMRMYKAFVDSHKAGYDKTIIIGTDCVTITPKDINLAFKKLESHDCVLGPAKDGGYYLIGLTRPLKSLFTNITWSGQEVLGQTLKKVKALKKKAYLLSPKEDIDTIDSLRKLAKRVVNSKASSYTKDALGKYNPNE